MSGDVFAVVLAAGKGTRMKSDMAKVLHVVFFAPMVNHVIDMLQQITLEKIVVVTGHQHKRVEESLSHYDVVFARQKEQLGTGHAVLSAQPYLRSGKGTVLILCGDTPLVKAETLKSMLAEHESKGAALSVMTTILSDPTNYGRVITDDSGSVLKIVEEKDASVDERLVQEVNAGIYCVELDFLFGALQKVGTDNAQGEVYLTDIVQIACNEGRQVTKFLCGDPLEITGVNSRVELAVAHKILQQRRNRDLMLQGISMYDPETTCIEPSVSVGQDTLIYGNCHLSGATTIGAGVTIEPFVNLHDRTIGDGCLVKSFTYATGNHLA
nr:NTP transferase domain-containing protein [Desulfobulbaceae bacterium]